MVSIVQEFEGPGILGIVLELTLGTAGSFK